MTFAPKLDLGLVVDGEDQAVDTYEGAVLPIRAEGWGRFAFDADLLNSRLSLWGRASAEAGSPLANVTQVFFDVQQTYLAIGGYYEITKPTMILELQFRWQTLDPDNLTKVGLLLGRPEGLREQKKGRFPL